MDMIWQEYQRRRLRKRAEWMHFSWTAELPSQSSRHDFSVLARKRGQGGQERQICEREWKQTWNFIESCSNVETSTSLRQEAGFGLVSTFLAIGSGSGLKAANAIQPICTFWCLMSQHLTGCACEFLIKTKAGFLSFFPFHPDRLSYK